MWFWKFIIFEFIDFLACCTLIQLHAMFDRFSYEDWTTPHSTAVSQIKQWDKQDKFSSASQQCMEREPEDEVMASIAKFLGTSIEDVVVSDDIR